MENSVVMRKILFTAACVLACCLSLQAQPGGGRGFPMMGRQPVRHSIILPDLLQGEIVLQQQTDARIWGKTEPGMEVTVHTPWNDCNYRVKAGADSLWSVKVATPTASYTPYDITVSNAKETITLYDVLIGDVWFCGGQSNMTMPLKGMFNCAVDNAAETILNSAKNKGMRYVTVAQHQATESDPGYFTEGRWQRSGPATAADFSATAYFFGQALLQTLDYPIGLISCNWSGSFVEDWVNKEFIEKYPNQEVFGVEFSKAFTKMYYGMLEPASKYTIKGMIWYQGESNVGSPNYTERLMAAVDLWKSKFELATLPFYLVELAPYNYNKGYEMLSGDLRAQQLKVAQSLPESGLACTNDLVYDYEGDQIHPAQKKAVGERLAMLALSKTYRMGNPCEGPVFREMIIDGGAASILFDNAANGFVNNGDIQGFEIAGEDGVFYPAKATVGFAMRRPAAAPAAAPAGPPAGRPAPGGAPAAQRPRGNGGGGMMGGGYAIRVSSDKVPNPVAVRYGYGPFKPGNLHNTEGLPAYPFRTDSWPLK